MSLLDYSVDIPAGDRCNTISVRVSHHNDGRRFTVRFTCTCDCLVYLVMRADESPEYWVLSPHPWQDLPTAEEEKQEEELQDRVQESEAAGRLLFTPTTICECGRRYHYLGHKPWIESLRKLAES